MSIVIDTHTWHFQNEQLVTIYTAVAVSEAVAEITKISSGIKWVNDLFLDDKKYLTIKLFSAII